MSMMQMDQAFVANTYKRFPVEIVSGKGSRVTDVNGKEYVDLCSGYAARAAGFQRTAALPLLRPRRRGLCIVRDDFF